MQKIDLAEKVRSLEERLAKLEKKDSHLSIVLFSGDFDKATAAFIIASGALAMGKQVSMFVTFWGLDVIKKPRFSTTGRNFLERMVLWMRPKGPLRLGTSKMNFAGVGPRLFRYMMGKKNVESLPSLIDMSIELGITLVACQMSMDVMGLKREDLLDGVQVGGVAAFLGSSFNSTATLFM